MNILADCHTHTNCSPDGKDSVIQMCQRAYDLGYTYYTVTDHCECNDYYGKALGFSYADGLRNSFEQLTEAENLFAGRLTVLKGLELGQAMQDVAAAEDALDRAYDFVLGSVHNIRGYEDFYYMNYDDLTDDYINGLLSEYFSEILETAKWGGMDSLAHLTYPLRYIQGDYGRLIGESCHQAEMEAVFQVLIDTEKALEINTSGLRQKIGKTLPDLPLLKRYYEMGGRLVTIGSDAHSMADLGKGINAGFQVLREAGFREYAVYKKRKPVLLSIPG